MEKNGGGLVTGSGLLAKQCQNIRPFLAIVPTKCVRSKISKNYPSSSVVLPFSWDCILTIYNELVKLVERIPFEKHLAVTIVCRGSKFRIDLGEVRAAGVVCLIGLGLSLGTLLLYKLYLRIIIPFLRSLRSGKGNNSWLDDEYTLYLDESESEVDSMGNNGSKRPSLPNVYFNRRNSGIMLGSRPSSPTSPTSPTSPKSRPSSLTSHSTNSGSVENLPYISSLPTCPTTTNNHITTPFAKPENVRLRPKSSVSSRHKSPSPGSDKDSAIGGAGGSEMSQSLYSDNSLNRDSFYSTGTAESGFDDLGFLEELRSSKLTGSLKENFSPNSLRERSLQMLYRAHRGKDMGLNAIAGSGLETLSDSESNHSGILSSCSTRSSCCSSDGTYITRTNVDPLEQKLSGGGSGDASYGHKRHISGGDKPGIAFSTRSGSGRCSRNNNNDNYHRQSSHSSSTNSKSSAFHPATSSNVGDRLRNNSGGGHSTSSHSHSSLRCLDNSYSDVDDDMRRRHHNHHQHHHHHHHHRDRHSPYRSSSNSSTSHHHQQQQPPRGHPSYGHQFLDTSHNPESIHSFDTSEDYDNINWHDGPEEEEEGIIAGEEGMGSFTEEEERDENERMEEEDEEEEDKSLSALPPHLNQSISDLHFRQSLMQRIQEWSSFAEEYNKSMSPTPECSPIRFVRRSRSLDRHLSDSSVIATESEIPSTKPLEIEPVTEKNLETLEYELHDIQGEFESITSKLHDLIEQQATPSTTTHTPLHLAPMSSSFPAAFTPSNKPMSQSYTSSSNNNNHVTINTPSDNDNSRTLPPPSPSSYKESPSASPKRRFEISKSTPCITKSSTRSDNKHLSSSSSSLRKMKTKWERVPGSACSDCSRSSRGSSVEYVWDMADYSLTSLNSTMASADRSRSSFGTGRRMSRSTGMTSTDLCPMDASDCVCNIQPPVSITDYCQQEWKGDTAKATAIRQGYHQIPSLVSCHRICVIRGDNYCAIRSALFQVLVAGIRIVPSSWGIIGIMDRLHDHFDDPSIQMNQWTFANRLPGHSKDKLACISKCALSLYATVEEVCNLPTREEREKRTINLFNASSTFDLELMEGVKVMMLLQLVSLRQRILDGDDQEAVPLFGHLLFARDTSDTVANFIKNHLNCVGDSGGLEQVEMCLLGYTLGVSLQVLRLSQAGQEDFQCNFPDDLPSSAPQVVLLAEDDRHYNVPLP